MAKGAIAKQEVISRIASAFGDDYIGEYDKKVYVWATEDDEKLQIALSLTCPKNPIEVEPVAAQTNDDGDWDFNDEKPPVEPIVVKAEITQEERDKIADLMAKLNL